MNDTKQAGRHFIIAKAFISAVVCAGFVCRAKYDSVNAKKHIYYERSECFECLHGMLRNFRFFRIGTHRHVGNLLQKPDTR